MNWAFENLTHTSQFRERDEVAIAETNCKNIELKLDLNWI